MIAACRRHDVKLMIAYRLHFEAITSKALDTRGNTTASPEPANHAPSREETDLDQGARRGRRLSPLRVRAAFLERKTRHPATI